eukprot:SAG31_NODE_4766_length_2970_cov_2.727969_4_plen_53_part_01
MQQVIDAYEPPLQTFLRWRAKFKLSLGTWIGSTGVAADTEFAHQSCGASATQV